MRVVNIKDLKARLSAYLRDVAHGETFLVTDRGVVVAKLGSPTTEPAGATEVSDDVVARLAAAGFRPPQRGRRPTDYRRAGSKSGLSTTEIDALVDWVRGEGS
jgi:antitoxin (DNA-binding transcriptional repressor) of toxin-antitoxin stability system